MFFFQAEDGIRDLVRSRGLGDVYKRQLLRRAVRVQRAVRGAGFVDDIAAAGRSDPGTVLRLSLIHI